MYLNRLRQLKRRPGACVNNGSLPTPFCVFCGSRLIAASAVMVALFVPAVCRAQDGTFPLPAGAPPSGLQAPLPNPSSKPKSPDKPQKTSPTLTAALDRSAGQPLELQRAVAIALYASRQLATAEESLLQAQGHTSETRAAFNPTLGSTYTLTQLNKDTVANIGGQTITLVDAQQQQIGLMATLPVDISGMLRTATDQAKLQEIVARLDVNRVRNQTVLDVKSAFYDALRAQALLDVAKESLRNSLARQSDAQKRLDAGVVAPYDLQRAATDVASSQLQVLNSQNQVSQSLYALKNTMGVDLSSPITITDKNATQLPPGVIEPENGPITPPRGIGDENYVIDPVTRTAPKPVVVTDPLPLLPEYNALLTDALNTRPEILEADASISAAEKNIRLAYKTKLPTMGITVSGSYTPNVAGLGAQSTTGSAVVSVNIPILDGGVERARMTQARASVSQAITNKRTVVDAVSLELQGAYQSLRIARDSMAVANESVALAKEAFRLARVRYTAGVTSQAGLSPLLEVTDAQTALTQAESNQVNALYDYNNARSRVDKAVGRYAFVYNGGKEPVYLGFPAPPSAKVLGKKTTGAK